MLWNLKLLAGFDLNDKVSLWHSDLPTVTKRVLEGWQSHIFYNTSKINEILSY